jgi:ABC-2 type transport system permease protein
MMILTIAFKDLLRSFRSAFAVGMTIIAPLSLVGLIYLSFGSGSDSAFGLPAINVGIVNADTSSANSPLEHPFGNDIRSVFFDESVASWITATDYTDETSARAALGAQEIGVAVIIPEGFSDGFFGEDGDVPILIIGDPTLSYAPQITENMVRAVLDGAAGGGIAIQTLVERQIANGHSPDPVKISTTIDAYSNWYIDFQRDLFHNPDNAALVMIAPSAGNEKEDPLQKVFGPMTAGQMAFFAFFTGAYSMMSILRENEEGTLARLFTTPVQHTTILVGKFLAVFLSVLVQGVVLIIASHYAFGINWGNPLPVLLALLGQVVVATGLGVLLISLVKTTQQAGPILGGGLTALGMLGGLFTANINMPDAFTMLANFTPQGWVIKIWKLVLAGAPLTEIWLLFAIMLLMGILMFSVGANNFGKRFA